MEPIPSAPGRASPSLHKVNGAPLASMGELARFEATRVPCAMVTGASAAPPHPARLVALRTPARFYDRYPVPDSTEPPDMREVPVRWLPDAAGAAFWVHRALLAAGHELKRKDIAVQLTRPTIAGTDDVDVAAGLAELLQHRWADESPPATFYLTDTGQARRGIHGLLPEQPHLREALDVLVSASGPVMPGQVADVLGIGRAATEQLLELLTRAGLAEFTQRPDGYDATYYGRKHSSAP